ncbi:hypothetical protein C4K18_3457 [Pseudomonas chlororaphis subsp. aurantiaca]|nr:hypothetical protein C4K18_3457 [Pseudomonas chlororaphis subsp. aurantiaca]
MPSIGQKQFLPGPCQFQFAPATQAEREPDVTFVLVAPKAEGEPQCLWCATRKFRGSAYSSSFVGGFDYRLGALQNNLNLHPRMFREIGIGHCGSSSRQGFRGEPSGRYKARYRRAVPLSRYRHSTEKNAMQKARQWAVTTPRESLW